MDAIGRFLAWAETKNVIVNGIEPQPLPGRGIGIVSARKLKANEDVLTIPTSILRTLQNTPQRIKHRLRGARVHAILATWLCLEASPDLDLWRAVFPSQEDMTACMPLNWPGQLQALLPFRAQAMLAKQQAILDQDWARVSSAYPDISEPAFLYAWLLVNSRCFYHTTRATAKLAKQDHMVMLPVADLFNHSSSPASSPRGCRVAFGETSFTITTTVPHEKGEELFIQYGAHSNDFLLVEYGFILDGSTNSWDDMCLDPYLCPMFSARQRAELERAGFWAEYALDDATPCYRTMTALRMLCLSAVRWRAVMLGRRDEDEDRHLVDQELLQVLARCQDDIRAKIGAVDICQHGTADMRDTLRRRWLQMNELVVTAMARLQ